MFGKQDDKPSQEAGDDALDQSANDTPAADSSGSDQSPDQADSQPGEQPIEQSVEEPANPESGESADIEPEAASGDLTEPDKSPDTEAGPQPSNDHGDPDGQHPGTPLNDKSEQEQISDVISPAGGYPKRPSYQYVTAGAGSNGLGSPDDDAVDHELIDIKHQAIGELSPLIDQLDLPPEEKFQAIMMVLQDSDNQDLVKAAYEAAHSIEDEKTRGLALLSIVNEINYFTQQPAAPETEQ